MGNNPALWHIQRRKTCDVVDGDQHIFYLRTRQAARPGPVVWRRAAKRAGWVVKQAAPGPSVAARCAAGPAIAFSIILTSEHVVRCPIGIKIGFFAGVATDIIPVMMGDQRD